MLYLLSTPIGNLRDLSFRAVEILNHCDYILCEDTRHSKTLMNSYEISTPLKSYHKFNEAMREEEVLADLKKGKQIGLISDSGTPCIADPGERLVHKCIEEGISLTAIPGPCALVQALICSGLGTFRFQFVGFLPKQQGKLKQELLKFLEYSGTTVCYESPQRIKKTLHVITALAPSRKVVIARELTKVFEEFLRGTAQTILDQIENRDLKGECVLLIEGQREEIWQDLSLKDHVLLIEKTHSVTRKEAIKIVAEARGMPKRTVYQELLKTEPS
ncbi:MAG: 16S rRNA (cytidine(1402)-2'-O)-methyltransferase [Chlamydiales bacterium]